MVENIQEALELSDRLAEASCDLKRSIEVFNDLSVDGAELIIFAAPNSTKRTKVELSPAEVQVVLETVLTFTEVRIKTYKDRLEQIINPSAEQRKSCSECISEASEELVVTEIAVTDTSDDPASPEGVIDVKRKPAIINKEFDDEINAMIEQIKSEPAASSDDDGVEHWPDKEPVPTHEDFSDIRPTRRPGRPKEAVPIEKILKLVNDGYSTSQIAKMLNLDVSGVYKRIKTYKDKVQKQRETEAKECASTE